MTEAGRRTTAGCAIRSAARHAGAVVVLCAAAVPTAPGGGGGSQGRDWAGAARTLWQQMRRADVDSEAFAAARRDLKALIEQMPSSARLSAAAAMMNRYADDTVNAAALEAFGSDPLPVEDVKRALGSERRPYGERLLLRIYFGFCRAEYKTSILSDAMRRRLLAVLSGRLGDLRGKEVSYGEQRLLTHLCSAALSRYAFRLATVPEAQRLAEAMSAYAGAARPDDGLAAAIRGWLALRQRRETLLTTVDSSLEAMGHWEPLIRWRAAAFLGERVAKDLRAATLVWAKIEDPRDEVRAAAVRVFGFAHRYRAVNIVPRMAYLLAWDRGVAVQAAAADVLIARAREAAEAIQPLLDALTTRRPGPRRTSSILAVLSQLSDQADEKQKHTLLEIAIGRLPVAPQGALAAIQSLGPTAAAAVPAVKAYRATADRFLRVKIDRHVLPAIEAGEPEDLE